MAIPIKRRKTASAHRPLANTTGFREAMAYLQGVADAAAAFGAGESEISLEQPGDHRGGSRLIDLASAHVTIEPLDLPELNAENVAPPPSRLTLFYGQELTAFGSPEAKAISLVPVGLQRGGARLFEIGNRGRLTIVPSSQRPTLPCNLQVDRPSSENVAAEASTISDIVPADARESGVQLHVPRLAGEWYQLVGSGSWGSWGSTG